MINTAPHSNSPHVMYTSIKDWFTRPHSKILYSKLLKYVERKKIGLICFPGLIYCHQESIYGS